ncbi:MAG: hypothetical protein ACNYPH_03215 [Gammaproteobacteria bacterium WSBS_2016_MAG_OTU1]
MSALQIAFEGGRAKPARELLGAAAQLTAEGAKVYFSDKLATHCTADSLRDAGVIVLSLEELRRADMAFVLGGDGTFLHAARHCAPLATFSDDSGILCF